MTTIAFTNKELAFDSLITQGTDRVGFGIKGKRLKTGELIAFAGDVAQGQLFVQWAEGGYLPDENKKKLEALKEPSYVVIVVTPGKKPVISVYDDGLLPCKYTSKYYAWGSGAPFALGAMVYGASAKEAVQVAKACDTCTGGNIKVLRLED